MIGKAFALAAIAFAYYAGRHPHPVIFRADGSYVPKTRFGEFYDFVQMNSLGVTLVFVALLLAGCGDSTPPPSPPPSPGWTVGFSAGVTLSQPAGALWQFGFPAYPNHVNMITKSVAGLSGSQITAGFQETESNPTWFWMFDADNTCNPGSLPQIHFYFQRAGDNFSGVGDLQYYRWWSMGFDIKPMNAAMSINLNDPSLWGSVLGVNGAVQPLMFQQAKDNASSVGFTFGGGCFAGHGVALKGGSATMTLKSFGVQ
jgi:hypothetical protein